MKYQSRLFFCALLSLLMTFSSCVKESDIVQEDTFETNSSVKSNLIFTSFDASSFISNELEQAELIFLTDTIYLEVTRSNFLMDDLTKTNLIFKLRNGIERDFKINIEFLNDVDELKFAFQIPVSSGTKEKPITVDTNIIIETPELVTFKDATKMVYNISMLSEEKELVTENQGLLELNSNATYFLKF